MNTKKEHNVNELFWEGYEPYGNMLTAHYMSESGVYFTYVWLFRYWNGPKPKESYFHAYMGEDGGTFYKKVDFEDLDNFKKEINEMFDREIKIDVLLNTK